MGQLWARHFFHSRDLFAVQRVCFQSDIIQGLAGIPRWGLWLPRQHGRQTQPRKWMCQITQCHPLGESCRCECVWVCVCAENEEFISTAVNVLLPIFPLTLSLTLISLFLCLIRLRSLLLPLSCSFFFSHKMKSEQLYPTLAPTRLAHFLFLPFHKCHNVDCSPISNHLRSNFLKLQCFSAD